MSATQVTPAIRAFEVGFDESELTELRRRIEATRWPERETVDDDSQGVPLATMQELARYWATDYNWRRCEARLNALPNFLTEIDGLDIHFIHVRSRHPDAMPLIITHGWPGSVFEQIKLIGPLTEPTKYGGRAEDAFDVARAGAKKSISSWLTRSASSWWTQCEASGRRSTRSRLGTSSWWGSASVGPR